MKKKLIPQERINESRYYTELQRNGWKIYVWGNVVMPEKPMNFVPQYGDVHTLNVIEENR